MVLKSNLNILEPFKQKSLFLCSPKKCKGNFFYIYFTVLGMDASHDGHDDDDDDDDLIRIKRSRLISLALLMPVSNAKETPTVAVVVVVVEWCRNSSGSGSNINNKVFD